MHPVLSRDEAKNISGGRIPLVPVEYESAVRSLSACLSLDEAKYWSDKSDALAAWARIYRHDEAGVAARRLKLYAYRRMGELARELRPWQPGARKGDPQGSGSRKGVPSLLVEKGLTIDQANAASAAAKIPKEKFEAFVSSAKPPAPSRLLAKFSDRKVSEAWRTVSGVAGGNSLIGFKAFCQGHDARSLAMGLTSDEAAKARDACVKILEWLDEFELSLRKMCDL